MSGWGGGAVGWSTADGEFVLVRRSSENKSKLSKTGSRSMYFL